MSTPNERRRNLGDPEGSPDMRDPSALQTQIQRDLDRQVRMLKFIDGCVNVLFIILLILILLMVFYL